ncbi:MAG: hypothetical protein JW816_02845 [Candidatus Buchananbacteria bacterium]|nr:hypothetical protein [Candidatus Buchananbacteria bacterium]
MSFKSGNKKLSRLKYLFFGFLFGFSFLFSTLAYSATRDFLPGAAEASANKAMEVPTSDATLQGLQEGTTVSRQEIADKELAERKLKEKLASWQAVAFKKGINFLFNKLAYDLATWIASGGKGEQPMFVTQGWGPYLEDVGSGALGFFVDSLSDFTGFDFCKPDLKVNLKIGLGLVKTKPPESSKCDIKTLVSNWKDFVGDKDFLNRFKYEFQPQYNDFTIGLKLFDKSLQFQADQIAVAEKTRQEGGGWKAVTSVISGRILTPSQEVKNKAESIKDLSWGSATTYTGYALADATATFAQTLASKLFDRLQEGLAPDSAYKSSSSRAGVQSDLYDASSPGSNSGVAGAQDRFAGFLDVNTAQGSEYSILDHLVSCSDIDNPAPDECAIDDNFRQAISQQLTVKQAIDRGLLDGNAPFGFVTKDFQPRYNEGYPYRSLLILRAHRIIPVTWELAAEIINSRLGENSSQVLTLNSLIDAYDDFGSPFYHLIDKNWVLRSYEEFCNALGPGPVITSETIVGDDRTLTRADYCADYQSCLQKDEQGNCIYGYCMEEKPIWNLGGTSCPNNYNTCQSFQDYNGKPVAYLQNTLTYNSCSADNAGCQWYCQDFNVVNGVWTCKNDAEDTFSSCTNVDGCPVTLDCSIEPGNVSCTKDNNLLTISSPCSQSSKFWDGQKNVCIVSSSCTIPYGGVSCRQSSCDALTNFVPNFGFESSASAFKLADNWTASSNTYIQRVGGSLEQVHTGTNSVRFFSQGDAGGNNQYFVSDPITLEAGDYSFSGYIFNSLNLGDVSFNIINEDGSAFNGGVKINFKDVFGVNDKNHWVQLSTKDFSISSAQAVKIKVVISDPNRVSGTVWFDDFRISKSCVTDSVTLYQSALVSKDESKIHFDRDVKTCDPDSDGCSQFLVAPEGIKGDNVSLNVFRNYQSASNPGSPQAFIVNTYNLFPDGGFENGEIDLQNIWAPVGGIVESIEKGDVHSGNSTLKLTNSGSVADPTVRTGVQTFIDLGSSLKNRTFILSFWAKASDANPGPLNSPNDNQDFIASQDLTYVTSVNVDRSITDGLGLTNRWKQFAVPIYFDQNLSNNLLLIALRPLDDPTKSIIYDDISLQEVDYTKMNPTILRDLNQDLCIGSGRFNLPYSIWDDSNNICYQVDLRGLLNRSDIYLKKAPAYLNCQGYTAERPGPNGEIDQTECGNYAPYCFADEVGCQAYNPVNGGQIIPGVINYQDICPAQCVGYQSYKQLPTAFETQETLNYFIANTAKQCNATEAGCDEFTNLDEVSKGGEGLNYFTYLKQCVIPSDSQANCSNYYTWEGSDETGYQLKVFTLSADSNPAVLGAPKLAIPEAARQPEEWGVCDENTVNINPFCRQLFDQAGRSHYVILQNTITCSDNCQPFRKTRLGEDDSEAQNNCDATNGSWDGSLRVCVYQGIPNEGLTCSAAAVGCRAYRGNNGSNIFTAFSDNFEDGDTLGWQFGQISSEALSISGHSIKSQSYDGRSILSVANSLSSGICNLENYPACASSSQTSCYDIDSGKCRAQSNNNTESCMVDYGKTACSAIGRALVAGQQYTISFWAKAAQNTISDAQLLFTNSTSGDKQFIPQDVNSSNLKWTLDTVWKYYSFGPFIYSGQTGDGTAFEIKTDSTNDFYVDNITIQGVKDLVYVIKNSWQTPQSCDQNPYVDPVANSPQFMLGCQQYRDLSGQTLNLKSFSNLCRQSVVGCQAMVDTHNSTSPYGQTFNGDDQISDVKIPADNIVYIVNRQEFQCRSDQMSCQRLGHPTLDRDKNVVDYNDVYLLNNPDNYQSILCANPEVGCQEFKTDNGYKYFKLPSDRTCEYRQNSQGRNYGWYKTNSSAADPDCPTIFSNLGIEYPDSSEEWVGLCPAKFSGCTEYVDPVSNISKNIVFNSSFSQDLKVKGSPDGWIVDTVNRSLRQNVDFKANKPYTVSLDFKAGWQSLNPEVSIICPSEIEIVSFDQSFSCAKNGSSAYCNLNLPSVDDSQGIKVSGRFFMPANYEGQTGCYLQLKANLQSGGIKETAQALLNKISVTQTGVYYRINDSVDKRSCNGLLNADLGCVLFNDRGQINYKLGDLDVSSLVFDADNAVQNSIPPSSCGSNCDSNTILKVTPDRMCNQWLDCKTKIKTYDEKGNQKDLCISLAACDSFDPSGACSHYVLGADQQINSFTASLDSQGTVNGLLDSVVAKTDVDLIANMSGFAKAGVSLDGSFSKKDINNNINTIFGYYPYNKMIQNGPVVKVPNGDFELSDDQYPLGWAPESADISRDTTIFKVVKPGRDASLEGIVVKGNGSLKIVADNVLFSETISVSPDTDYRISVDLNTQNLQPKDAQALVDVIDVDTGNSLYTPELVTANPIRKIVQTARSLPEWQTHTEIFHSGLTTTRIKIKLTNSNSLVPAEKIAGASYFDNVSLLPVLKVSDEYNSNPADQMYKGWLDPYYVNRSCRIFPNSGAPSCNYISDNGLEVRGINGYCLASDPLHPDTCLQWWPVDLINGDAIGNLPSYIGRYPLYYCLQSGSDQTKHPNTMIKVRDKDDPTLPPIRVLTNADPGKHCEAGDFKTTHFAPTDLERILKFSEVCFLPPENRTNFTSFIARANGDEFLDYALLPENSVSMSGQTVWFNNKNPWCVPYAKSGDGEPIITPDNCDPDENRTTPVYFVPDFWNPGGNDQADRTLNNGFCLTEERPYLSGQISDNGWSLSLKFTTEGQFDGYDVTWCDDDNDGSDFYIDRVFMSSYNTCSVVAQTVSSLGASLPWTARVTPGSDYVVPDLGYQYDAGVTLNNYPPFGSLVPPAPSYDPVRWFGYKTNDKNGAGLIYQQPNTAFPAPYQARAGLPYSCYFTADDGTKKECESNFFDIEDIFQIPISEDVAINRLKRLFANVYGIWKWDAANGRYEPDNSNQYLWSPPTQLCEVNDQNIRPQAFCTTDADGSVTKYLPEKPCIIESETGQQAFCSSEAGVGSKSVCALFYGDARVDPSSNTDYCAVAPKVTNIKINNSENILPLSNRTGLYSIQLSFNVIIDPNQLPLSAYKINWGDGIEVVSGAALRDRSDDQSPYKFNHTYSYYDILDKNPGVCTGVSCNVVPKIQVIDNWGWCNSQSANSGFYGKNCDINSGAWSSGPTLEIGIQE